MFLCDVLLSTRSQEMFDASLKDRELSFKSAPGTTMFLHWLVGMVYVFYFASFILLLREVGLWRLLFAFIGAFLRLPLD